MVDRTEEPLIVTRRGHTAEVILNRPSRRNAIDGRMLELLDAAVRYVEGADRIRAVLIRGAGPGFCAGADLDDVEAHIDADTFGAFLERWHAVFGAIERCKKPTVAAVHGIALAGGLELVQVCDVVVAAADASFGDQHAKLGLFPGGGATQRLPRLVGRRMASWLLLSGARFEPDEALAMGLVTRVVPAADLLEISRGMAAELAAGSASANALIKQAILDGSSMALDPALALERALAVEHMRHPDAKAGIEAFRAKRVPVFAAPDDSSEEISYV